MALQGVSSNIIAIHEGNKHPKNSYEPRKQVSLWEKPFKWSVKHLRGTEGAGIIKRLFDLAIGLLAALPLALTGIGALLLWREYVIEKEDEAFKSAQVKASAARAKLVAKNKKIVKSTTAKLQKSLNSTVQQAKAHVQQLKTQAQKQIQSLQNQIANLRTELDNRPSQESWEAELNKRGNITPEDLANLQQRLATFSQELKTKVCTQAQLDQAIREAEARGAANKVPQDTYASLLNQYQQLQTQHENLSENLMNYVSQNAQLQKQLRAVEQQRDARANITPQLLEQYNSHIEQLQKEINQLKTRPDVTQDQLSALNTLLGNDISQDRLNALLESTRISVNELAALQARPDITQDQLNALMERPEITQDQLDQLQARPDITQYELDQLLARPNITQDQLDQLQARPEITQDQLNALMARLNETQVNEQIVQALREEAGIHEERINNLSQEVENLNRAIEATMSLDTYHRLIHNLATWYAQPNDNPTTEDSLKAKAGEILAALTRGE